MATKTLDERFAQILGYTVDEVMALPSVLDTVYEADRDMVAENIRARLTGARQQIRYSLRGRKKDGSPVELEVQGRRIMYEGKPAVVGVQCDVSERAREERNYHARQKADALAAMAAGVAHDFKNILGAIGITAELIAPEVDEQVASDLAEIREVVRRGTSLCQRLMAFGSAESASDRASASVREVFAGIVPIVERLFAPRRLKLRVCMDEELPRVPITPSELEQVVMNLVMNGGDASPDGAEVELLAMREGSSEAPRVLLRVRDRGCGMPPELVERIFEPYFTTKGDKGNGLGLRNVWLIVTGAGGDVRVESSAGEGSTFTVVL